MGKSALAVAVSQLLDPNGNTPNPYDMTGRMPPKQEKVAVADMSATQYDNMAFASLEVYFDKARRKLLEKYTAVALSKRWDEETAQDQMHDLFGKVFPNGRVTYNEQRTMLTCFRGIDEYLYKCAIRSIKSFPLHGAKVNPKTGKLKLGKLAAKDGGFKGGKRTSAATWQSSNAKALKNLRLAMAKNRKVIDPAVLKMYAAAFAAWDQALRADRKAS